MHEVRLFQGWREFLSDAVLEVEVQTVVTKSVSNAVATLSRILAWAPHLYAIGKFSEADASSWADAVAVIGDMEDVAPHHCEQLLGLLKRRFNPGLEKSLGAAFGRACGSSFKQKIPARLQTKGHV